MKDQKPKQTRYLELIRDLLGREPASAPLVQPTLDNPEPRRFVEDIHPEDDRRLFLLVNSNFRILSLGEWDSLDEDERIPFLQKVLFDKKELERSRSSDGELKATQRHLEDMRRLLFEDKRILKGMPDA